MKRASYPALQTDERRALTCIVWPLRPSRVWRYDSGSVARDFCRNTFPQGI